MENVQKYYLKKGVLRRQLDLVRQAEVELYTQAGWSCSTLEEEVNIGREESGCFDLLD